MSPESLGVFFGIAIVTITLCSALIVAVFKLFRKLREQIAETTTVKVGGNGNGGGVGMKTADALGFIADSVTAVRSDVRVVSDRVVGLEGSVHRAHAKTDAAIAKAEETRAALEAHAHEEAQWDEGVRNEVERVRGEVEASRARVEEIRAHTEETRSGVERIRAHVEEARSGLGDKRANIEGVRAGVEATRAGVEAARAGVEATRADVEETRAGVEDKRADIKKGDKENPNG
jgi:chromosome segregation ATPase